MAKITIPYGQDEALEIDVQNPRDSAEVRAAISDVAARNKLNLSDPTMGTFLDRAYGKQSGSALAKAFSPIAALTDTIGAAVTPLVANIAKYNTEQDLALGIPPGLLGTNQLKNAMDAGDFRTVRDIRARESAPERLKSLADAPVELSKTFANAFAPWQERNLLQEAPQPNRASLAKVQEATVGRQLTPGEDLAYALISPENFVPIERIASIPQLIRGGKTAAAAKELANSPTVLRDAEEVARELLTPAKDAKISVDTTLKRMEFEDISKKAETTTTALNQTKKTAEDLLKEKLAIERSLANGERTNTLRAELRKRYKSVPDQNLTWQQYQDKYSITSATDADFKEYQKIIKEKAPDKFNQLARSRKVAEAGIPRDLEQLQARMGEIDNQLSQVNSKANALTQANEELRSLQASKALTLSNTSPEIKIEPTLLKRPAPTISELAGKQLTPQAAELVSKEVAPLTKAVEQSVEDAATSGPKLQRLAQNVLKEAEAEKALYGSMLDQAKANGKLIKPHSATPVSQVFDTVFSNIRPEGNVLKSIGTSAKYLQDLVTGAKVVSTVVGNKLQSMLKAIDTKIANIPAQDVYAAQLARIEGRGPEGLSAAGKLVYNEFQQVADYAKDLIKSNNLEMLDKSGKVVPFQAIDVFAPRRMSPEYNQAVGLVKSGGMSIDKFANEFGFASIEAAKDAVKSTYPADALFASLKARGSQNLSITQRMFLDTSVDVWKQYASDLSHAIGSQTMYGGAQGRVLQAIEAATKSAVQAGKVAPKDLKRVQDFLEFLRGGQRINNATLSSAVNLSRAIANFQIGPKSMLWQLLQGGMAWSTTSTKAFGKALSALMSKNETELTKALGIGLDFDTAGGFRRAMELDNVLESNIAQASGKYVEGMGIGKFDLLMRKITRLAGAARAEELFNILKKTPNDKEAIHFFEEFAPGVDITEALKRGHLAVDEVAEAGLRMDREVNFWQEVGTLPALVSRIPGLGILFKTAYLQSISVKRLIIDEAARGNIYPAIKYSLVSLGIGELGRTYDSLIDAIGAKDKPKQNKVGRGEPSFAMQAAQRVGEDLLMGTGIVGSIYQGAKNRGLEGAFSSALGQNPLGVAKNVGNLAYSLGRQLQITDIMPLLTGFAGKNLLSKNPAQAEAAFRTLKDAAALIGAAQPIKEGAKLMEDKYKKERKAKEKK